MGYQIIRGKEGFDQTYIKEFDEQQYHDICKMVNNLDVDAFGSYDISYKSRFNDFPGGEERERLYNLINQINDRNGNVIRDSEKSNSYEWIHINKKEIENTTFRFYFGVNPMNLYTLVEKLIDKFSSNNTPVYFKFQKEVLRNNVDRIILYTDTKHKDEIERLINEVYNENRELFDGAERALPWIYNSKVPNVFFAPEALSHNKSYGELFESAIQDSKKVFHYLFQEEKVRNKEQMEALKKIVISMMFKNGLLLSKNGKRLGTFETDITIFYDKKKNELKTVHEDNDGYYEIIYDSSLDGKKAFLSNCYSVKTANYYPGMKCRKLSKEQRNKEIYAFLYPNQNPNQNQPGGYQK